MRIAVTGNGCVDIMHPAQGIGFIKKAGFEYVSVSENAYADLRERVKYPGKSAYFDEIDKRFVSSVSDIKAEGIEPLVMESPSAVQRRDVHDTADLAEHINDMSLKAAKKTVKLAEGSNCGYILVRPLWDGISRDKLREKNLEYYKKIASACTKPETVILIPNTARLLNGHWMRGFLTEERESVSFLDELCAFDDRFRYCLDVSAASVCGKDFRELLVTLGGRVEAVLLADCDGNDIKHLLPFSCGQATDWLGLIRGLREISFDGVLVMDCADGSNAFPLIIRQKFFEMARETAEYFKWQIGLETAMKKYDHIVLFGAGNMCRNYIKNFGEKYPPIFTCDNNKNLWGNDFEGIIVHSPEDLLKLDDPDHTGIFICNMYYTEIRKQLEDMGIKNIEYFSDEFLSLYNYDRLDMIERSLGEKNAE